MAEQKIDLSCSKCEDHNKVNYILSDVATRLDSIDEVLVTVATLSARVSLLITIVAIGSSLILTGCVYTFTALPDFKETYATHILETQKQIATNQEEGKNFTRSEVARINAEWSAKMSALDTKISNIENMVRDQKYSK